MNEYLDTILDTIENCKERLTDIEYKSVLENLAKLHEREEQFYLVSCIQTYLNGTIIINEELSIERKTTPFMFSIKKMYLCRGNIDTIKEKIGDFMFYSEFQPYVYKNMSDTSKTLDQLDILIKTEKGDSFLDTLQISQENVFILSVEKLVV